MRKRFWLILPALAVLALGFFALRSDPSREGIELVRAQTADESEETREAPATQAAEKLLTVHVCGAVRRPGVYSLPAGSRRIEALDMAGGFLPEADPAYVNLAALITDGEQLYFPAAEEAAALRKAAAEKAAGVVNINTAGQDELETLPGIGESLARAVIEYRSLHGPFEAIEDIMRVPGIKEAAFSKIRYRITVSE